MNPASFFGTDGIRGKVGNFPITEEFAFILGQALRQWLIQQSLPGQLAIGRDTRRSGEMLQQALAEGLGSGTKVWDLGVLATPAIAFATRYYPVSAGISITASHNAAMDNGFKILDANGNKLSRPQELHLEEIIRRNLSISPSGEGKNDAADIQNCHGDALRQYIQKWEACFPAEPLRGMRLVLDTANGATSAYGAALLQTVGAEVIAIGNSPDGDNINDHCGSEHPENLLRHVRKHHADGGLAVDGDGDRALICDSRGRILPGEHLLAALALRQRRKYPSHQECLMTTIQANGALDIFLKQQGIGVQRCDVGDRNVAEKMAEFNIPVGGEPSGHVICEEFGPLADGLLTGVAFFEGLPSQNSWENCQQSHYFPLHPAVAINLPVREKIPLAQKPFFHGKLLRLQQQLGSGGNILLRYSGTENKLRLRVEAPEESTARAVIAALIEAWESCET